MSFNKSVSWPKAIGGSICAIIVFFAVSYSIMLGLQMAMSTNIPLIVIGAIVAVLYPGLTYFGLKICMEKLFKIPLNTLRFTQFKIHTTGIIIGILIPCLTVLAYQFVSGEWLTASIVNIHNIIYHLLFAGIAVALVEEMVFRGVVMGVLEKCSNIRIAIVISSILFAAAHLIQISCTPVNLILLIVAGTSFGMLCSLLSYCYNSFWNNALVHAAWNGVLLNIIHIGPKASDNAVFSYVLNSDSVLITGGEFGFESSAITVSAYLLVVGIMLFIIRRRHHIAKDSHSLPDDISEQQAIEE